MESVDVPVSFPEWYMQQQLDSLDEDSLQDWSVFSVDIPVS